MAGTDSVSRYLTGEQILALPSREAASFLTIQPGIHAWNDALYIRGGRPEEISYEVEGFTTRSLFRTDLTGGAGCTAWYHGGPCDVLPLIPEALEAVRVDLGESSARFGGGSAFVVRSELRTGGDRLGALAQYEGDRLRLLPGTYSYGYDRLTATLDGPLLAGGHRFFAAVSYRDTDDYAPAFWEAADLGTPVDRDNAEPAPEPLRWRDGVLPGIGRPMEQLRINGTVSLDFDPLSARLIVAHLSSGRRLNPEPVENFYNQERLPRREDASLLAGGQADLDIGERFRVGIRAGFFRHSYETFDPLLDRPQADGEGGAVLDLIDYFSRDAVSAALRNRPAVADRYTRFWPEDRLDPGWMWSNGFVFYLPGHVATTYDRGTQSYMVLNVNADTRWTDHRLAVSAGFTRWTASMYRLNARGLAEELRRQPAFADAIREEAPSVARMIRRAAYGGVGYDEFMNRVERENDPNAPRHPSSAVIHVEDLITKEDFAVRFGLRWDYFDMDQRSPKAPSELLYDHLDASFRALSNPGGVAVLQPRLALSLEPFHRTTVWFRYGRHAQMPDLDPVLRSQGEMSYALSGQHFVTDPIAWELRPIRITQFETGVARRIGRAATLDVAAFSRRSTRLPEITHEELPVSAGGYTYFVYVSRGDALVRGLEATLRASRNRPLTALVNYTFTHGRARNSYANSSVATLDYGSTQPTAYRPLSFVPRHHATVAVMYQPEAAAGWRGSLVVTVRSGYPYTRSGGSFGGSRTAGDGPLLTDLDPRPRHPLEPLGESTTPSTWNVDMRLERSVSVGRVSLTPYAFVENLLGVRQVENVYLRTGSTDRDGLFRDFPTIVESLGTEYERYYRAINLANRLHYMGDTGTDLFAPPRIVRLGLRVEI